MERNITSTYLSKELLENVPINYGISEFVEICLLYCIGRYKHDIEFRQVFTALRNRRQEELQEQKRG